MEALIFYGKGWDFYFLQFRDMITLILSAEVWEIYLEEAEKSDKRTVQGWKDDMDGTLIFVRDSASALADG
jgi:hypothetical protein